MRRAHRTIRRSVAVGVFLVLAAGSLAACGDDGVDAGEARLTVTGIVEVTPVDGESRQVTNGTTLATGDRVQVVEGVAALETTGGRHYELRPGPPASLVEVADAVRLHEGDMLLADGYPVTARLGEWTVDADGPTKVRAGSDAAPASVTSYAGAATARGAGGREFEVPALHTTLLPSGETFPLRFTPSDSWDRRFLGESISLGNRLEALGRGYTADLQPTATRSAAFYERILPGLASEAEFSNELVDPAREPGEVVVGAAIALAGTDGPFRQRWHRVFEFRDAGAAWGLVVHREQVGSVPVLDAIEIAVAESPLSDDPRIAPPTTAPPTTTVDTPDDPTTTRPPSSIPVPPLAPPTTDEPREDDDGLIGPILEPVGNVLDEVLSILGLGSPDG